MWLKALVVCTGLALLAAGGLFFWIYSVGSNPLVLEEAAIVQVERGASLKSQLRALEKNGVIKDSLSAYYYARLKGHTQIRTGEYEFLPGETIDELLVALGKGRVRTEQFTLAEGLNRWQVRDVLSEAGWMDAETFDRLCDDEDFLARHQVPGPSCEGYLYPETYRFARGIAAETIFKELLGTFRGVHGEITAQGRGPLDLDVREFVTLASIVEKETGAPHERPRIACVFYNRLKAKPAWRLQTDPTVIYAAILDDPNFNGDLKTWHLRELKNPYNTYTNYGLPPGPIANPGRAAFEAVANPDECGDFFFVSKNNGEHVFCPTLDCHNAAVQKWQIEYFRKK